MSELLQSVIDDLVSREQRGLKKYNTSMDRIDLSEQDWRIHLYEELLDAILYLKKQINGTQRPTDYEEKNQ